MYRYVALIWNAADAGQGASVQVLIDRLTAAASGWTDVFHQRGLIVLSAHGDPASLDARVLAGNAGVVLGVLFVKDPITTGLAHESFSMRRSRTRF